MTATPTSKGRSRKAAATSTPSPRKARKLAAVPEPEPTPALEEEPTPAKPKRAALRNADRRNEATHPDGAAAVAFAKCPTCGARKGVRCTSKRGEPTNFVHMPRFRAWEASPGAVPAVLSADDWAEHKRARREAAKATR